VGALNQTFQLIRGNHRYALAAAPVNNDYFSVFRYLVTQSCKVCPGVCVGCFEHAIDPLLNGTTIRYIYCPEASML